MAYGIKTKSQGQGNLFPAGKRDFCPQLKNWVLPGQPGLGQLLHATIATVSILIFFCNHHKNALAKIPPSGIITRTNAAFCRRDNLPQR
ncbi:MAG: hypothetical protein WC001_10680 [Desulfurivibrionaceae bacterium]